MSSDSPWGRTLGEYVVVDNGIDWFLCSCGEGKFPDIVLSSPIHPLLINLFLIIGTNRYFSKVVATQMGIEITFVDASDLSKLKDGIKPNTKVCSEF